MTGTLLLALVAALSCEALHTPIPWMIGPLLVTGVLSVCGAPVQSWTPLRNAGQCVIGTALGLYFTPSVGQLVLGLWWAIVLAIAWSLLLGLAVAAWLHHRHRALVPDATPGQWRATAYFAGAIGGASEMTQIAERQGARTDLVAAAHSVRLLLVTLAIPFGMVLWGVSGLELAPPAAREVVPAGLGVLAVLAGAGALLMQRLGRANPWFIGALVVAMVLTLAGLTLSAIPAALSNAAQLVIGVSLGVRFTPAFVRAAPRWLASVAMASVALMLLSAAFAAGLHRLTALHPATLVLGTSPGGIAEMAITAKVLQLGVPVVTAFQVCRLVAVLLLAEPVYQRWVSR